MNSKNEATTDAIAITNAVIIDMVGGYVSGNMTLMEHDNMIFGMAPSVEMRIPKNAAIFDGAGKYTGR